MWNPSHDTNRIWLWFAVSSVAFVTVLAVSPVKDYLREYRAYFHEYKRLLVEKADSSRDLRAARSETLHIRQLWLREFGNQVDRCITCHLGVENSQMADVPEPWRLHPVTPHTPDDFPRFGCVSCHRGQGRATTVADAHGEVPDWDSPLLPVRYTEASCGRCHLDDTVPEASMLSMGRSLMDEMGCYGCHKLEGHEGWQSQASDLAGLSQKTSPAWLIAWLKSPQEVTPGTKMPDFRLTDDEVQSLASFLWAQPATDEQRPGSSGELPTGDAVRGRKVFRSSRCISCHTVEGKGNGSAAELSGIGSKTNRRWLVAFLADPEAFQPHTPMPRYRFSREDLLDLSQYLMEEFSMPETDGPRPALLSSRRAIQDGEALFRMYGCGGCHRIAGRQYPGQIGPELTGIGDSAVEFLDFGERHDLSRQITDWLAAKISDPGSFRDSMKMPDFEFAPEQIEALVTALLSSTEEPVPSSYRVTRMEPHYVAPGRFGRLVARYRCLSCHEVDGVGGDISQAPLSIEGSRVKKEWLKDYLLHPRTIRPILTDRMIPLGMLEEEAEFMADFMENVYVDNSIPGEIFPDGPPPEKVARGRDLFFGRYGCQACHQSGGKGGYYGPLLDEAPQRLRSGFVFWWLRGPQRWRDDVRCPDYGLDETDARDLAAYVSSAAPTVSDNGTP